MLLLYEVFFSALVEQYALLIQHTPVRKPRFVRLQVRRPALVIASACSWENLTQKTDWHDVNGVCVFLLEGYTASQGTEARVQTCLPASPSPSPGCSHEDARLWAGPHCPSGPSPTPGEWPATGKDPQIVLQGFHLLVFPSLFVF